MTADCAWQFIPACQPMDLDPVAFACTNVGIGFCVSWLLSHYFIPWFLKIDRDHKRPTTITVVYTIVALIRNVIIYDIFTN